MSEQRRQSSRPVLEAGQTAARPTTAPMIAATVGPAPVPTNSARWWPTYPTTVWTPTTDTELVSLYDSDLTTGAIADRLALDDTVVIHRLVDLLLDGRSHGATSAWSAGGMTLGDRTAAAIGRYRSGESVGEIAQSLELPRDVVGSAIIVAARPGVPVGVRRRLAQGLTGISDAT